MDTIITPDMALLKVENAAAKISASVNLSEHMVDAECGNIDLKWTLWAFD